AESGFWQIIGNTGHIFHPSSDDDLVEAKLDALSSEHNCLHTRCANFIDRSAGNGVGQTSFDGSLPGRSLPQIGGHHVAHAYLTWHTRINPGQLRGSVDCCRSPCCALRTCKYTTNARSPGSCR